MSAVGWSGGQLEKRWICKVVSWSRRLCQRLVCSVQLTCFDVNWDLEAEPSVLRRFLQIFPKKKNNFYADFSKKKTAFLSLFWSKFLLKNMLFKDCKVCWSASQACIQDSLPPLVPPYYATAQMEMCAEEYRSSLFYSLKIFFYTSKELISTIQLKKQ